VYPPYIYEITLQDLQDEVNEEEDEKETKKGKVVIPYYDPPSLLTIGLGEVVRHMQPKTDHFGKQSSFITPNMVNYTLPDHLKQMLCYFFIHGRTPKGSADFGDFAIKNNLGFSSPESVACCGVKMNSQDVEILCCIQGANIKLKKLELTLNKLDARGISRLVHSLSSRLWPILMKLDLSLNILDISSLKNILNGLPEVFSLRCLRLSNCGIRSSGAQMIAEFLSTNCFLEELDLSFNKVEASGAEFLAQSLKKNIHLKELSLRKCHIGATGAQAFSKLLQVNRVLSALCLADNNIGIELAAQIAGRSRASVGKIIRSTCATETRIPDKYRLSVLRAKLTHQ